MSDARLFRLCLLASLPLTAFAFVLLGWFWKPTALAAPLTRLTHIRLVTLPPAPAPKPPPVQVAVTRPPVARPAPRRLPRVLPRPKPHPPKPPRPKKHTRPGARVPKSSAAPLAAPAGGSDAGAPAPSATAAAPPPPTPTPDVVTSPQTRSPLVAHNVEATPTRTPAPSDAGTTPEAPAAPTATAAPASDAGRGGAPEGKGAGSGEGTGTGQGIGAGTSKDAGEPFGVGKGQTGDGGPRHVVYVLDISGSMTSRIDRAEAELRRALDGLQPGETFNVVVFSDEARAFDTGMAPATPEVKGQADRFLNTLQVTGGTNLEAAMRLALSRPGVNEVVLLTDGVPTEGETDFKALRREVRELNSRHARLSAVGLVGKNPDGTDDSFEAADLLRQIAYDSGGTCKLVTLGVAEP